MFSRFWRPEVRNQGVAQSYSLRRLQGRVLAASPSSGVPDNPHIPGLVAVSLQTLPPSSHGRLPVCLRVPSSLIFSGHQGHPTPVRPLVNLITSSMTLFPNKVSLTDLGGPGMNMPFWGDTVQHAQMLTPLGECVGAQEGYQKTIYQLQRGRTLGKDPASPRVPQHVARAATQPPRTVLPNKRALAIRPCCRKLGRGYGPTRKHFAGSDHLLNKPSPSWIVLDSQTSHRRDRVCPSPTHPRVGT